MIFNTDVKTGIRERISNINKNLALEDDTTVDIYFEEILRIIFFTYKYKPFLGSHESNLPDEAIIQNVETVGYKNCY